MRKLFERKLGKEFIGSLYCILADFPEMDLNLLNLLSAAEVINLRFSPDFSFLNDMKQYICDNLCCDPGIHFLDTLFGPFTSRRVFERYVGMLSHDPSDSECIPLPFEFLKTHSLAFYFFCNKRLCAKNNFVFPNQFEIQSVDNANSIFQKKSAETMKCWIERIHSLHPKERIVRRFLFEIFFPLLFKTTSPINRSDGKNFWNDFDLCLKSMTEKNWIKKSVYSWVESRIVFVGDTQFFDQQINVSFFNGIGTSNSVTMDINNRIASIIDSSIREMFMNCWECIQNACSMQSSVQSLLYRYSESYQFLTQKDFSQLFHFMDEVKLVDIILCALFLKECPHYLSIESDILVQQLLSCGRGDFADVQSMENEWNDVKQRRRTCHGYTTTKWKEQSLVDFRTGNNDVVDRILLPDLSDLFYHTIKLRKDINFCNFDTDFSLESCNCGYGVQFFKFFPEPNSSFLFKPSSIVSTINSKRISNGLESLPIFNDTSLQHLKQCSLERENDLGNSSQQMETNDTMSDDDSDFDIFGSKIFSYEIQCGDRVEKINWKSYNSPKMEPFFSLENKYKKACLDFMKFKLFSNSNNLGFETVNHILTIDGFASLTPFEKSIKLDELFAKNIFGIILGTSRSFMNDAQKEITKQQIIKLCSSQKVLQGSVCGFGKTLVDAFCFLFLYYNGILKRIVVTCKSNLFEGWVKEFSFICNHFGISIPSFYDLSKIQNWVAKNKEKACKSFVESGGVIFATIAAAGKISEMFEKDLIYSNTLLCVDECHQLKREDTDVFSSVFSAVGMANYIVFNSATLFNEKFSSVQAMLRCFCYKKDLIIRKVDDVVPIFNKYLVRGKVVFNFRFSATLIVLRKSGLFSSFFNDYCLLYNINQSPSPDEVGLSAISHKEVQAIFSTPDIFLAKSGGGRVEKKEIPEVLWKYFYDDQDNLIEKSPSLNPKLVVIREFVEEVAENKEKGIIFVSSKLFMDYIKSYIEGEQWIGGKKKKK